MKNIICLILIALSLGTNAQDWPLRSKVLEKRLSNIDLPIFSPFLPGITVMRSYRELAIDQVQLQKFRELQPEIIQLDIPLSNEDSMTCELIRADMGAMEFSENRIKYVADVKKPVCYRGVVKGLREKNNVMLTVNDNYFSLEVVLNKKVIQIVRADEDPVHIYRLVDIPAATAPTTFNCGTNSLPSSAALSAMQKAASQNVIEASQDKCIYIFVECFDSLWQWRDSSYQATVDYVFALFNGVATGYLNELINIKIASINVWTVTDPYRGDSRENALADLSANYQDNFFGNICVGLDFSIGQNPGRSGLAGAIGRMKGVGPNSCPAYTAANHQFCYNDLDYNVNVSNFPTGPNVTQQAVYLVMHEIGHLVGSSHTHWCGWLISTNPNTFGALDNCAPVEGTCSPGPAPPASGGTIMSYCVGTGENTNFNNGFGTIPGNTIRAFVDGHACVLNCPTCPAILGVGDLPSGSIGFYEASNTITAYGNIPSNNTTTIDAGVKVTLINGFRANNGAKVKIIINGCGGLQ